MNTRVVGISLLTLALAGGATALAFAQSSRSASIPAAAANTGRDVGDGDGEEDDDGPETDQVVALDQVPAGVRTDAHACDASAPFSFGCPGGGSVSKYPET